MTLWLNTEDVENYLVFVHEKQLTTGDYGGRRELGNIVSFRLDLTFAGLFGGTYLLRATGYEEYPNKTGYTGN